MITGRKKELESLETAYRAKEPMIVYLTGENGVGKTALLLDFLSSHKNGFYFDARNTSASINESFLSSELVAQGLSNENSCGGDILTALFNKARGDRVILALDDVRLAQDIVKKILQKLSERKNQQHSPLRLLLILSGDIDADMLASLESCAIGLSTLHIPLSPLTYLDAMPFYNTFSDEDKVVLYGITGGFPGYLRLIDTSKSFRENLYSMYFSKTSPLFHEGRCYLEGKVRQPSIYHAVLYAIACGKVRLGEIADAVELDYNKLSKYISSLMNMGIIDRIIPASEQHIKKQHKKTFYAIHSNMLFFWYRFIFPVQSSILLGLGKKLMRTGILSSMNDYAHKVFFDICMQYCHVLKKRGKFFTDFSEIGYYWKQNPARDSLYLMTSSPEHTCLVQCLWDNPKIHVRHLQAFVREGAETGAENFFIFSRNGFTSSALQYSAKHPNIWLLSLYYIK